MNVGVGSGNPAGRDDCGICTEPIIGGPWLTIRMFEVGTVAKNPGLPPTGLTWTMLVKGPRVWIVACWGMLNATSGSGVVEAVEVVDGVVVADGVVVVVVVVEDEPCEPVGITPDTCCEPIRELNAGDWNRR